VIYGIIRDVSLAFARD